MTFHRALICRDGRNYLFVDLRCFLLACLRLLEILLFVLIFFFFGELFLWGVLWSESLSLLSLLLLLLLELLLELSELESLLLLLLELLELLSLLEDDEEISLTELRSSLFHSDVCECNWKSKHLPFLLLLQLLRLHFVLLFHCHRHQFRLDCSLLHFTFFLFQLFFAEAR